MNSVTGIILNDPVIPDKSPRDCNNTSYKNKHISLVALVQVLSTHLVMLEETKVVIIHLNETDKIL